MKKQSKQFRVKWLADALILWTWIVVMAAALSAPNWFTVGVGFLLWMQLRHMSITQPTRK